MADLTAAVRNSMVDWLVGTASPAAAATRYIAPFNGDPQAGGTELTNTISGSATRPTLTSAMGAASGGAAVNTTDITFTNSAVGGGTVDHVAIMSAATAGTVMASTAVNAAKTVAIGDSLKILSGNLSAGIT